MAFYDYHFVTHWKINGPIKLVYDILTDGKNYARWWTPAYVSSERVGEKTFKTLVRARLPYTLEFTTKAIREVEPTEFEIQSTGELAGRGLWKLQSSGEITDVTFYWDVQATKPLVKWLSLFLKPVFKWNHDWVMRTGGKCLQEEVNLRQLFYY